MTDETPWLDIVFHAFTPGGAFDLKRIGFLTMSTAVALSSSGAGQVAAPPEALDRLVAAYPDMLARHDDEHIYWRDGTVMAVSDGIKNKSFDQLFEERFNFRSV
jgi:hypothetical protein